MLNPSPLVVVGTVVAVAAGIISFLLAQPDVVLAPTVKVILGAANIALTILALRLNLNGPTE